MRATLLDHACWLLEITAGFFLTGPVLGDPFEEGTVSAAHTRGQRNRGHKPCDVPMLG